MIQAIRERVTIKPGGTIEIRDPDLPVGVTAEVIVMIEQPQVEPPPLTCLIGKGTGCFSSIEEVDAFLRAERDAWER